MAQEVPIVQPGAPGQPSKALSAQEAVQIADTRFSPDDVRFMQDMIRHHHQAVRMAALVEDRTNQKVLIDAAGRIDASQADEIAFMQTWLRSEEHTSELQSLMRISYAVFCLKKKTLSTNNHTQYHIHHTKS